MLCIALLVITNGFLQVVCQKDFRPESTSENNLEQNTIQYISPTDENADGNSSETRNEEIGLKSSTLILNSLIDFNVKPAIVNYEPEHEENLSIDSSTPNTKPIFRFTTKIFNSDTAINKKPTEKKIPREFQVSTFLDIIKTSKLGPTVINVTKEPELDTATEAHLKVTANVLEKKIPIVNETEETHENVTREEALDFDDTTIPIEELKMTEDPVEKQINEAINSMPKLPELVLSDNKTHIKFHKNSEEMLIDEKITLIARQLAEKSLRKQYEEQLGRHTSSRSLEPSHRKSIDNHGHSIKTGYAKISVLFPTPASDFKTLDMKIDPYYQQKNFWSSKSPLIQNELLYNTPVASTSKQDEETYKSMTNLPQIMKANKSDNQIREINAILKIKKEATRGDKNFNLVTPNLTYFKKPLKQNDKFFQNTEKSILISNLLSVNENARLELPNNKTFYSHADVDELNAKKS